MARSPVWHALTSVGPGAPVARGHGSLFHQGSRHGHDQLVVDHAVLRRARIRQVRTVWRKKVVVSQAHSMAVIARVPGLVAQIEGSFPLVLCRLIAL